MTSNVLNELDLVTLQQDIPDRGLKRGDVGTVVFVHNEGRGYEVEFVRADGKTLGVETLSAGQVKPFSGKQILHGRDLTTA
jgi:hypothetical protein